MLLNLSEDSDFDSRGEENDEVEVQEREENVFEAAVLLLGAGTRRAKESKKLFMLLQKSVVLI